MEAVAQSKTNLTGLRKAAIALASLGERASAEILKQLGREQVQALSVEMARLGSIPPDDVMAVLSELSTAARMKSGSTRGGLQFARRVLEEAFGPEEGPLFLQAVQSGANEPADLRALQEIEGEQLARAVRNEHPQTLALVIAHLPTAQASAMLKALPGPLRAEVSARLAKLEHISPAVVDKVARRIREKISSISLDKRRPAGGVRTVADLLNQMDAAASEEILQALEEREPELSKAIQDMLFVFEDLLTLNQQSLREVFSRVDKKVLTMALKGTSDNLQEHILQTMSQRAAEMIREDIEALGPVRIREVEAAQQQIIEVVRRLEKEGVISTRGGVEQFVM